MISKPPKIMLSLGALAMATAIWLPCVHLFFAGNNLASTKGDISPQSRALAARHLELWTNPRRKEQELARMRRSNAEWDFMGRTFLVWSLAEMSLREPRNQADYLNVMDQIIDETLRLEQEQGLFFFLMPYAKDRSFVRQPPRSQFLDGEIAMMLAARRLVRERSDYKPLLGERIETMIERMKQSPVFSAESYPDECWTFCNSIALASIKAADGLDGTDHAAFLEQWVATAKRKLVHAQSGLLISSYTLDGTALDGPEGSSVWLAAHCLRLVDEDFARDQYERARRELGRDWMGFAWSREWPVSWRSPMDVDSGMVIPIVDISAGGSGLAFVGASSFGDCGFLSRLSTTIDFAGFPCRRNGQLKYCASNQVGDAVIWYASVLGPMWEKIKAGGKR